MATGHILQAHWERGTAFPTKTADSKTSPEECADKWYPRKCKKHQAECSHKGYVQYSCGRTCNICAAAFVSEPFSNARLEAHARVGASILANPQQPTYQRHPPTTSAHPSAAYSGADMGSPVWDHLISPALLGFPELNTDTPEDFFTRILLPAVPRSAGPQLIVDVGANVGQFALAIADAGHDGLCYEASPTTCHQLQASVAKHQGRAERPSLLDPHSWFMRARGTVRVRCVAIGSKAGNMTFGMKRNGRNASFGQATAGSTSALSGSVSVPVAKLDDELPNSAVLLLKTDTQGFDLGVLQGAALLMQRGLVRLLLVEMSHELLNLAGTSPLQLMRHVASAGFVCTYLQFFSVVDLKKRRYGPRPTPPSVLRARSLSFEQMDDLLESLPPYNTTAWTDLLCWFALPLE